MFDIIARAMAHNANTVAQTAAPYIVTFYTDGGVLACDRTVSEVFEAMETKVVIATYDDDVIGSPIVVEVGKIGWIPIEGTYLISNFNDAWVKHVV